MPFAILARIRTSGSGNFVLKGKIEHESGDVVQTFGAKGTMQGNDGIGAIPFNFYEVQFSHTGRYTISIELEGSESPPITEHFVVVTAK